MVARKVLAVIRRSKVRPGISTEMIMARTRLSRSRTNMALRTLLRQGQIFEIRPNLYRSI